MPSIEVVFQRFVHGGGALYSERDTWARLGGADRMVVEAQVSNVSGSSPALSVALEHSADGSAWTDKTMLVDDAPLTVGASQALYGSDPGVYATARFARLRVTLGGAGTNGASVRVLARTLSDMQAPPLLSLAAGTFARASDAWWASDDELVVERFGSGMLRRAYEGRYALGGAVTNHLTDDPVDITPTGGWAKNDASGTYTIDRNAAVAPDGTTTAARHDFGANASDYVVDSAVGYVGSTTYRVSVWARAEAGTKAFRFMYNDVAATSSGDFTATQAWQRFEWTFTTAASPNNDWIALRNGSGANAGAVLFWGMTLQDDVPDLHPGPVLAAGATKAADDLAVTGLDGAGALMTEGFWLRCWPYFDNTALAATGHQRLVAPSGTLFLGFHDLGTGRIRVADDVGNNTTGNLTWSARQELTLVVDWLRAELRIGGFTSGDGTTALGGDWSGQTSVQVGNQGGLALPYFGDISDLYPLDTAPI